MALPYCRRDLLFVHARVEWLCKRRDVYYLDFSLLLMGFLGAGEGYLLDGTLLRSWRSGFYVWCIGWDVFLMNASALFSAVMISSEYVTRFKIYGFSTNALIT